MTAIKKWYEVATVRDIDDQEALQIEVNGVYIALFNLDGKFYATDDRCPVFDASLADSYIEDDLVYVDDDRLSYEIRTGMPCHDPKDTPLKRYPVKIDNGLVYVGLVIDPTYPV
ncbi:MAG: Rieske family ferredoxin [marine bacterium B5-7]|nr:MAG: Rieske family ferredoxin [marine bacterium B5-7]